MAHRFIPACIAICPTAGEKADVGRHALLLAAQYGKSVGASRSPLRYVEYGTGTAEIMPLDAAAYGDVVLARKDVPTSYHLAVVVDDAAQNISQVTRGRDLQSATAIHVLLQKLLGLPQPDYLHHGLVRDTSGRRLSKQAGDSGFRDLRQAGMGLDEVLALLPPPFGAGLSANPRGT